MLHIFLAKQYFSPKNQTRHNCQNFNTNILVGVCSILMNKNMQKYVNMKTEQIDEELCPLTAGAWRRGGELNFQLHTHHLSSRLLVFIGIHWHLLVTFFFQICWFNNLFISPMLHTTSVFAFIGALLVSDLLIYFVHAHRMFFFFSFS